jgi:7-cyano-7-deazaguanine synthase in queuosine biosynthesis
MQEVAANEAMGASRVSASVGARRHVPTVVAGMTATKAQLIRKAPPAADRALAATVSCDTGFSARVPHHAPCGTCTSCILRRQALHAAGKAYLDAQSRIGRTAAL